LRETKARRSVRQWWKWKKKKVEQVEVEREEEKGMAENLLAMRRFKVLDGEWTDGAN
jgi:hypothetical protein